MHDVEKTLLISVCLVVLVVFVFLRSPRATLIPAVAVPVSLIGTFAVMYLFGYSLDNLSLMALTIATGFVVDDAIVVMENITRHLESGMEPFAAALKGAQEIGFTVFSISISLIAVFIPILMMGGIVGRLFREFAVTLSTAIVVSMVISLTTTPCMCAHLLKAHMHGVVVSEMTIEMTMAVESVTANSRKRRPTMPPIIRMGMKTAISDMLMEKTVKPISCAPFIAAAKGSMPLFKMPRDVLHHHDGIVNHKSRGDGERHQRQVVERVAEQVHHGEGSDERNRNGDAGNERGARAAQKQEDHQDDQANGTDQRLFDGDD